MRMHVCIFESLQLEDSYIGGFTVKELEIEIYLLTG